MAQETDIDQDSVDNSNRRFIRLGPNADEEVHNDNDNNDNNADSGRFDESRPEPFIREKFHQRPTPKTAFDIAYLVERRAVNSLDWMKGKAVSYNDQQAFDFLANLQQRLKRRMDRFDRFATRLFDSNDLTSLVIADTYLEAYIN